MRKKNCGLYGDLFSFIFGMFDIFGTECESERYCSFRWRITGNHRAQILDFGDEIKTNVTKSKTFGLVNFPNFGANRETAVHVRPLIFFCFEIHFVVHFVVELIRDTNSNIHAMQFILCFNRWCFDRIELTPPFLYNLLRHFSVHSFPLTKFPVTTFAQLLMENFIFFFSVCLQSAIQ